MNPIKIARHGFFIGWALLAVWLGEPALAIGLAVLFGLSIFDGRSHA